MHSQHLPLVGGGLARDVHADTRLGASQGKLLKQLSLLPQEDRHLRRIRLYVQLHSSDVVHIVAKACFRL
jgi:hypothetical protein